MFNADLLYELRAIGFVRRLIDEGKLSTDEYRRVLTHHIHGGAELDVYATSSHFDARWEFFKKLNDRGRTAARTWLERNY